MVRWILVIANWKKLKCFVVGCFVFCLAVVGFMAYRKALTPDYRVFSSRGFMIYIEPMKCEKLVNSNYYFRRIIPLD